MESEGVVRAAVGLRAQLGFMDLNGEYSFGDQSGFALGVSFAFRSIPEN